MSQATLVERPYVNSNLFSGHYLDERVNDRDEWGCDEAAAQAFDEIQSLYELEGDLVDGYGEDALIDNWIDEVLDSLGYGAQAEVTLPNGGGYVDELLFETQTSRREAASIYLDTEDTTDLFDRGIGILEAKQWDADFTRRFNEQRPYRNASHQIKHYLENTPENIQWGILTNGRKWRLYGTKDYETQTYYEVDLPELIERGNLEEFKYFYVFFRPAAFRESADTTFLDEVWSESETASQELGEDLQDNVFTALRVLGRGFVETNNLDIDPDDQESLDELKDQSLVLLYRLMFVLYSEARGLIHPEGQAAQEEFKENFSLDALRLEVHETIGEVDEGFEDEFSEHSTSYWSRLEDLFRLIDQGEESLGIPPYNGGLFDHEAHEFLTENEVSNRYLAEVIYRLSTTESSEGRYVLADYGDLDTRHLGTVYEGLLEHQFRIAPEQYAAVEENSGQVWKPASEVTVADAVETVPKGGLFVVNDQGERKATGAYYTPDYVVTYIVEETVGPLVEEIREDLTDQNFEPGTQEYIGPFLRQITDLRILDPAMGSGHFLTRATGYLAGEVMTEVREVESEMGVAFDEQHVRREIAKECIYGVDLNGMAVELAKLSMWLETLAADRPLAFLDHHFKEGNSLVGSDIEAIEELESDANGDDQQASLAEFGATREGTIERLMDIYSEFLAIQNETVEDVREMKRKYAEIEQDELRRRLVAMANVHTSERFGLDVPGGAYERMAKALEDNDEWATLIQTDWFNTAQTIADEQDFFHWKLAFPEVFYKQGGTTRGDAGFDAVIGNPPYVKIQNLRRSAPEFADYALRTFDIATGRFDIYALFVKVGAELTADGRFSYILPNKFFESDAGKPLRQYLVSNELLREIVDFGRHQVFEGVTTYTCILSLQRGGQVFEYAEATEASEIGIDQAPRAEIELDDLDNEKWALTGPRERNVLNKLREGGTPIKDQSQYLSEGIVSGDNKVLFVDVVDRNGETVEIECAVDGVHYELESEIVKPLLRGDIIERFGSTQAQEAVVYPHEIHRGETRPIPEEKLQNEYPLTFQYLSHFKERLADRGTGDMRYREWYALYRSREKQLFEAPKVITPDVCQRCEFTVDHSGTIFLPDTAYGIVPEQNEKRHREYLLAVLNSAPMWFFVYHTSSVLRGDFRRFKTSYLSPLPVPDASPETERDTEPSFENVIEDEEMCPGEHLSDLAHVALNLSEQRDDLNLALLDYIHPYSEGPMLSNIGIYQPPEGVGDTKLAATKEDYGNIRIGTVMCEREDESTIVIHATARYKPDDEDAHETDQWGYTETEAIPAMRLTDLSETEADLLRAFVPVAVEKAGGFANFRETATKTNSLIDRLEALTLPAPNEVADDIDRYMDAVERAEEFDEKIKKTDELIDEIVYELYGLTDEEIEIVEQSVADD